MQGKKDTKRITSMPMDGAAWEAVQKVNSCHDVHELLRIAKQRAGEKPDAIELNCLKDVSSVVKAGVNDWKKIWKEHVERMINVENKWGATLLPVRC